jgi:hypothetical protein
LRPALRKYWPFLIGLPIFHAVALFGPDMKINDGVFMVLFLAAMFPAMWPATFGDAPYSFWVVAVLYWFFGFFLMALIGAVITSTIGAAVSSSTSTLVPHVA